MDRKQVGGEDKHAKLWSKHCLKIIPGPNRFLGVHHYIAPTWTRPRGSSEAPEATEQDTDEQKSYTVLCLRMSNLLLLPHPTPPPPGLAADQDDVRDAAPAGHLVAGPGDAEADGAAARRQHLCPAEEQGQRSAGHRHGHGEERRSVPWRHNRQRSCRGTVVWDARHSLLCHGDVIYEFTAGFVKREILNIK